MTRPRLLVISFRVCVVAVIVCVVLALALVLPTRVTAAAASVFLFFLVRSRGFVLPTVLYHARLPTPVRLTVVTELAEVRVQAAARVNEGASTLL